MYYRSRRRRSWWKPWLVGILVVAGLAILLLAVNPASFREYLIGKLGDERRHQIIALTSSINQRSVDTEEMVPIRYTGVNPLGVNTFLEQEVEESKLRGTMEMIKAAGIGWIRQQFPWEDIERPSKGRYWDEKWGKSTWEKYDNIVKLANEYGIQLIVRLDLPPKWAHPGNPWPHTPPEDFEDYGISCTLLSAGTRQGQILSALERAQPGYRMGQQTGGCRRIRPPLEDRLPEGQTSRPRRRDSSARP